jgi:hypothetical protein
MEKEFKKTEKGKKAKGSAGLFALLAAQPKGGRGLMRVVKGQSWPCAASRPRKREEGKEGNRAHVGLGLVSGWARPLAG